MNTLRIWPLVHTFALAILFVANGAWAKNSPRAHNVVVNGEMRAMVPAARGTEPARGRVSAHLQFTDESIEQGVVLVKALNWVAFGVDQRAITGIEPKGKAASALGFSISPAEPQALRLDGRTLSGKLRGQLSLDQFFEIAPVRTKGDGHDIDMTTLPAELEIVLELDRTWQPPANVEQQGVETRKVDARIQIRADPYRPLKLRRPLEIESVADLRLEIDWIIWFEAARRLCIQPVRIGRLSVTYSDIFGIRFPTGISLVYSGDGLAFGQPGVTREWNKADIVFTYRDWITIWDASYNTLTDGEMSSLRAEVDEDDCIETFFVDRFDPQTMDGGGNTVSGGTESAKVVSSDENADFGVDLTHLAHEFGHVLTLKHPGQGFPTAAVPHRVDGSSNTLMCASGFNNDNPKRNSQWNKENVANPLLTYALKQWTAGVDCNNDADCGNCP